VSYLRPVLTILLELIRNKNNFCPFGSSSAGFSKVMSPSPTSYYIFPYHSVNSSCLAGHSLDSKAAVFPYTSSKHITETYTDLGTAPGKVFQPVNAF